METVKHETFYELLLGEMNLHQWAFSVLIMSMGVFLYLAMRIKNRKNRNISFSIKIWFNDPQNILAIPISLILGYLLIRFYANYQQSLLAWLPEGAEMTPYFTMLVVGFYQHKISDIITKKALTS